jgi:hypothetical protein
MDKLAAISPQMAASLAQTNNRPADLHAAAEQFEALVYSPAFETGALGQTC